MRADEIYQRLVEAKISPVIDSGRVVNRADQERRVNLLQGVPGIGDRANKLLVAIHELDAGHTAQNEAILMALKEEVNAYRMHLIRFLQEWAPPKDSEPGAAFVAMSAGAMGTPDEFKKVFDDVVGDFHRLALTVVGEGVQVSGLRQGSSWLMLIGSGPVMAFLWGLVRIIYWGRGREILLERQKLEARQAKVQTEMIEALGAIHVSVLRQKAENLLTQHRRDGLSEEEFNEAVTRAVTYLDTLSKFIADNGRVALAAAAPEEVRSQLPLEAGGTMQSLPTDPLLELHQPQLPEGSDKPS